MIQVQLQSKVCIQKYNYTSNIKMYIFCITSLLLTLNHQGSYRSTGWEAFFPQESEGKKLRLSLEGKRHESDLVKKLEFLTEGKRKVCFPLLVIWSYLIIFDPSILTKSFIFFLFLCLIWLKWVWFLTGRPWKKDVFWFFGHPHIDTLQIGLWDTKERSMVMVSTCRLPWCCCCWWWWWLFSLLLLLLSL